MAAVEAPNLLLGETTCGSLLQQLRHIWDGVGVTDEDRDKMLLQLEQECLDVYKRKVYLAAKSRAKLLQALANARVELTILLAALGEKTFVGIDVGMWLEEINLGSYREIFKENRGTS